MKPLALLSKFELQFRRLQERLAIGVAIAIGSVLSPEAVAQQLEEASQVEEDTSAAFSADDIEFFESSVRPILVNRCYDCHGPDSLFDGNLDLGSRAAIVLGGDSGAGIVPGEPSESLIIDAINYGDLYQMPPDSRMPEEEVAILTEWVERGAPWTPGEAEAIAKRHGGFDLQARKQEHWCWQAVSSIEPPKVANANWSRDDIDRFILARLEEAGLEPNPPADKTTWLRRVTFDLIGMPPSPAEVKAFLADDSPQAYETVVDRLLQSPHFGERWARHWMDLVRFAETCGHEFDYPIPHAWRYRDYLIRAFNDDIAYDQFVKEQIAGDLLNQPRRNPTDGTNESIVGTGFWFLGEATHAPVDVRGDEATRVDNQIDVMTKSFLGLTVACARCHDHKFDAISTKDYYALAGFLQSSRRQLAMLDPHQQIAKATEEVKTAREKGRGAVQDEFKRFASAVTIEQCDQLLSSSLFPRSTASESHTEMQLNRLLLATESAKHDPGSPLYIFARLLAESKKADLTPMTRREHLQATLQSSLEQIAKAKKDAAAFEEQSQPFWDATSNGTSDWFLTGQAFEEVVEPRQLLFHSLYLATHNESPAPRANVGTLHSGLLAREAYGVARSPSFTITHPRIAIKLQAANADIRLIIDGYVMHEYSTLLFKDTIRRNFSTDGKSQWLVLGGDINRYLGHRAHLEFIDHGDGFVAIEEIRFLENGEPASPPSQWLDQRVAECGDDLDHWLAAYTLDLFNHIEQFPNSLNQDEVSSPIQFEWQRSLANVAHQVLLTGDIENEAKPDFIGDYQRAVSSLPKPRLVTAMADGTGENEFVFVRGNHRVLGEEAPRQMLTAIVDIQDSQNYNGSGRLQLAEQIASADNPLTSRVIVNRLWHHLFGKGIVGSIDNFGVLGQQPTHPELLDYLAHELTEAHDWSLKAMIRRMVLSSTYRMSSHPSVEGNEIDPANELLHRMRIRRLQGEAIRDAMLMVSQELDSQVGGPSIPVHLNSFMQGRGRPGKSGPLDGDGRRSLYIEVRRNFLTPMMIAFDTPIPFSTVGRRNVSNVPAQALMLLNDPFVHQQAKRWAEQTLSEKDRTLDDRIHLMYLEAFSRAATQTEVAQAKSFLQSQAEERGAAQGIDPQFNDRNEAMVNVWTDLAHILFNVKEFIYLN